MFSGTLIKNYGCFMDTFLSTCTVNKSTDFRHFYNFKFSNMFNSIKDKIILSLKIYEIVYMHSHYLNIDEGEKNHEHLLQYSKGVLRISSYYCINNFIYYFNLKFEDLNNFLKIHSIS
ncbi:LOW QUALITY PROTEIN: hypothetical protein V1477_009817 [Vespula maculifrons]|uniref:Uncharacterized protein n=1 Tax=Vespula maculifrons TaxID=7453 RepID=A0ABD2CD35_VESMC